MRIYYVLIELQCWLLEHLRLPAGSSPFFNPFRKRRHWRTSKTPADRGNAHTLCVSATQLFSDKQFLQAVVVFADKVSAGRLPRVHRGIGSIACWCWDGDACYCYLFVNLSVHCCVLFSLTFWVTLQQLGEECLFIGWGHLSRERFSCFQCVPG